MKSKLMALCIATSMLFTGCSAAKTPPQPSSPVETKVEEPAPIAVTTPEVKEADGVITTDELKTNLGKDGWVVVDTRLNDSYNGWQLDGEERSGHIKGAVDFSANWLKQEVENKEEILAKALETKGILPEKNIVLYDANGKDASLVAEYLKEKGYKNLFTYDVKEWAKDSTLSMEAYPNYKLIVPAKAVKQILDGETPATFENANVKMVEASWGESKESYDKGHIPNAFHIDTDSFEPPPAWMLDTDEHLAGWALTNGFTANDTVIVSSEYQMAAYRLAVVLEYIGVKDVRVLNGGNGAWLNAGYQLETEKHLPVASTDFGASIPANKSKIVSIPELKERLEKPEQYCLVDNRGWDEYIGENSGYSYHDKKGRIPGAVYGYSGTGGSSDLNYYRNIDNTMRNANEIVSLWKESKIDTTKGLMFMCGSGWRAAEVLYYANTLGMDNVSLYSDGWIGWSNDAANPTVTGEPAK